MLRVVQTSFNSCYIIISYHCEEILILHNKPNPFPPILLDDTKVGRCNLCFSWQQLEVVVKPHPVSQLRRGGDTRYLGGRRRKGGGRDGAVSEICMIINNSKAEGYLVDYRK